MSFADDADKLFNRVHVARRFARSLDFATMGLASAAMGFVSSRNPRSYSNMPSSRTALLSA